jgi:hypothetical protein
MTDQDRAVRTVRVLLTITALEFFGPIVRDYGPSHVFNPTWVGHARLHLVWLLGFMGLSGITNLWLVWFRRPFELANLWLSVAWQSCNLAGFWIAIALSDEYEGVITLPETHVHIFGWDENVFVFTVLTAILAAASALLLRVGGRGGPRAAR